MVRLQVQFSDPVYRDLKRVAHQRDLSLAELTRRAVELYVRRFHGGETTNWKPPQPQSLGKFQASEDQWRMLANERE